MDQILFYRIVALLVISFVYMLFDVFNKRNVPNVYAYGALFVGIIFTLLYYPDFQAIIISTAVATIIGAIGYFVYKAGQIGAADIYEFVTISLILPFQQIPFIGVDQYGFPFILSIFIATGFVALVMIPIYYLPRARKILGKNLSGMIDRRDYYKGLILLIAYLFFILFLAVELYAEALGIVLLSVIAISSIITVIFERPISDSMIEYITVNRFEEGDIIATNLMKKSEIAAIRKKYGPFDRLVTLKKISEMKKLGIKTKFPVYRTAMPLALPIFVGVVICLLFGNLILIII